MYRLVSLLTVVVFLGLPGCLVIPIGENEKEPFPVHKFDFIEVGHTTKADIEAAMTQFVWETLDGEVVLSLEPVQFQDGAVWLYGQKRKEVPLAYGSFGGGGIQRSDDYRYLLIRFDDNAVVSEYELSKSEGKGCNKSGVCTRLEAHMLMDSESGDLQAKEFLPPSQACGIYVFGRKVKIGALVRFDGYRLGWLVDNRSFFYLETEPGLHGLESKTPDEAIYQLQSFRCEAGELVFYEIRHKGNVYLYSTETHWLSPDASTARNAISKRKRLLNASYVPESAEEMRACPGTC